MVDIRLFRKKKRMATTNGKIFETDSLIQKPYKRRVLPHDHDMWMEARGMGLCVLPSTYVDATDLYGLFTRKVFQVEDCIVDLGMPTLTTKEMMEELW